MNSDELKGKWEQIKGNLRQQWGKLTDQDWQEVKGSKEKIIGKIQERYGITKEKAEQEYNDFCHKCKNHKDH